MSTKTILREPAQHIGLEKKGNLKNCNNCAGKKSMAEVNGIPVCHNCFANIIENQVGPMK